MVRNDPNFKGEKEEVSQMTGLRVPAIDTEVQGFRLFTGMGSAVNSMLNALKWFLRIRRTVGDVG